MSQHCITNYQSMIFYGKTLTFHVDHLRSAESSVLSLKNKINLNDP